MGLCLQPGQPDPQDPLGDLLPQGLFCSCCPEGGRGNQPRVAIPASKGPSCFWPGCLDHTV